MQYHLSPLIPSAALYSQQQETPCFATTPIQAFTRVSGPASSISAGGPERSAPATRRRSARLAGEARALLADIREHAEHEETYFRPWLDSVDPALTARFEAEHRELEPVMDAVDGTAAALEADSGDARTWKRFYSEFMRFTARYLLHIDGEEIAVIPGLWARYSDAELVSTVQSFLSARSPAQRAADMGWMLPAVSHERTHAPSADDPGRAPPRRRSRGCGGWPPACWTRRPTGAWRPSWPRDPRRRSGPRGV